MKRLLIILSILFPFVARAATYPNYFVTNASPFSVVSGVSMYVPSLYSTNMVSTNLSVTDYLFIGTAQVNYLTMLGGINQQGLVYTNYFQVETNHFRGNVQASNVYARDILANSLTVSNLSNPIGGTNVTIDYYRIGVTNGANYFSIGSPPHVGGAVFTGIIDGSTTGSFQSKNQSPSTGAAYVGHGMRRYGTGSGFDFLYGENINPTTGEAGVDIFPIASSSNVASNSTVLFRVSGNTGLTNGVTFVQNTNVPVRVDVNVSGTVKAGTTASIPAAFNSLSTNNFILRTPDGGSWILRCDNAGTLTTVTNASGL